MINISWLLEDNRPIFLYKDLRHGGIIKIRAHAQWKADEIASNHGCMEYLDVVAPLSAQYSE